MDKEDGGPAFPIKRRLTQQELTFGTVKDGDELYHLGMSLRDWFAGQALNTFSQNAVPENIAKACFEIADAMIEARKK